MKIRIWIPGPFTDWSFSDLAVSTFLIIGLNTEIYNSQKLRKYMQARRFNKHIVKAELEIDNY